MSLANVYAWETCFLIMLVSFNFVSTICYGFFSSCPFSAKALGFRNFTATIVLTKIVSWVVLFIASFVVFSGGGGSNIFGMGVICISSNLILLCSRKVGLGAEDHV